VRMFNSTGQAVTATLNPAFAIESAQRCDLEERSRSTLAVAADGSVAVPLGPAQIASVVLQPHSAGTDRTSGDRPTLGQEVIPS
jgi:hypothetical protein